MHRKRDHLTDSRGENIGVKEVTLALPGVADLFVADQCPVLVFAHRVQRLSGTKETKEIKL